MLENISGVCHAPGTNMMVGLAISIENTRIIVPVVLENGKSWDGRSGSKIFICYE